MQKKIVENNSERKAFCNMAFITYCITLAVVVCSLIMQFDSMPENRVFDFYCCKDVSVATFIISTIFQTLVPTTITFCGTILILQSHANQGSSVRVWLFISIIGLALLGTCQTAVQSEKTLLIISALLIILTPISFILSEKEFYLPDLSTGQNNRKNEKSDGKPVS